MPWLNVPDTTPLVINVNFVVADDSPPPNPHSLAGPAGGVILGKMGLPVNTVNRFETLLSTGLPQVFQSIWAAQQSNIQIQISNAFTTKVGAHDITSTVPLTGGYLRASVDPLGSETAGLLPQTSSGASQPGQQLSLSYTVGGIQVDFSAGSAASILGAGFLGLFGVSIGTPTWHIGFDAQLNFYLAVPTDATVSMAFKVEFVAANISFPKPTNLAAYLSIPAALGLDFLSIVAGQGSVFPSSSTASVSDPTLTEFFSDMSQGFVSASALGFTQLAVQINTDQQNAVQFDLTHPFDRGPTPRDYYVPWLSSQAIKLSKSTARPGDQITVTGTYWTAPDPSTIAITWDDTSSGPTLQTDINFGQVFPPSMANPPNTRTVTFDRTPVGTTYPAFQSPPLPPSSTFAFRLRDYDLTPSIATAWGPWVNFTTGLALGQSATIALSDNPSVALSTTTILPGGAFVTTFTIPAAQTPGTYNVLAAAAPNLSAQFPITVIAASQSLPALLELYDPITEAPYAAPNPLVITPANPIYLAGLNWQQGEVDVYLNDVTGPSLGNSVADPSGIFKLSTSIDEVIQEQNPAAAQIWAQQGSVGAGLPIDLLSVPK